MTIAIPCIVQALFCRIVIYIILYGIPYITSAVPFLLNGTRNDLLK